MTDPGQPTAERMPGWVWKAVAIFWGGWLAAVYLRGLISSLRPLLILLLVSLFLSLAIEPGVNRLSRRGWRRGSATGVILIGVLLITLLFVVAIGALVGEQIADLLSDSETYVRRTVDFLNDNFRTNISATEVIDSVNDPDGPVQRFIRSQQARVVDLSVTALGVLLQILSVMLFTFYLVADGPKLRRAILSRLPPGRQHGVLGGWDLAIEKTGGYLYSRALLAGISAAAHVLVLTILGTRAPLALGLWVGVMSQFLPVIGTYIAGALPVLVTFIDSPLKAMVVLIFVVVYQQIENYLLLPRITSRTMDLHPAIAFGSAIGGAAVLGPVGAILAIPAAAMAQAVISDLGQRHHVIDNPLTRETPRRRTWRRRRKATVMEVPPPPGRDDLGPGGLDDPGDGLDGGVDGGVGNGLT